MSNISNNLVKLVSDREKELFHIVNFTVITKVISLLGVVSNIINIVVFYKQGFSSTMNISFFGLAISDLGCLLTLLWYCVCVNPLFERSDVSMASWEVLYLTAGLPRICFARITGWITVYITAERCLCIMLPLKIKQIITPRRTTLTLCIIYLVSSGCLIPEYATAYLDWKFYPHRNRTLLGLVFTQNRKTYEGLVFILFSVIGFLSFLAAIVFTAVLVAQLKGKSKWREKANVKSNATECISGRERKSMKMVVVITTILIVCYVPGVVISLAAVFEPEFSIGGFFTNVFYVSGSFALLVDSINSSVNILLYYKMSSNYRETFNQIVGVTDAK